MGSIFYMSDEDELLFFTLYPIEDRAKCCIIIYTYLMFGCIPKLHRMVTRIKNFMMSCFMYMHRTVYKI